MTTANAVSRHLARYMIFGTEDLRRHLDDVHQDHRRFADFEELDRAHMAIHIVVAREIDRGSPWATELQRHLEGVE